MPMKPLKLTPRQCYLIQTYRELFRNTGGAQVEELLERRDIDPDANIFVFTMHIGVLAQLGMLERLADERLLRIW